MSERTATQVVTGVVRLSFVHVWEPTSMQDGAPKKYSAALLIPKSDKATITAINKAIEAATIAGIPKWGGKKPAVLKMPLRDGDLEKPDDENYKGHYWINATSSQQPGVLDRNKVELIDKTKLYSGVYAMVDINFYAFPSSGNASTTGGNKGIACGLNNILLVKDGPALAGKESAKVSFANVTVPEDDTDGL